VARGFALGSQHQAFSALLKKALRKNFHHLDFLQMPMIIRSMLRMCSVNTNDKNYLKTSFTLCDCASPASLVIALFLTGQNLPHCDKGTFFTQYVHRKKGNVSEHQSRNLVITNLMMPNSSGCS